MTLRGTFHCISVLAVVNAVLRSIPWKAAASTLSTKGLLSFCSFLELMLIAPSCFWTWVVKEKFLSRKKGICRYRVAYTNEREPLESTSVYCFKRKRKGIAIFFSSSENLMKLSPDSCIKGSTQRTFNWKFCRARRVVANIFGRTSSTFRVLRKSLLFN